jgi:FkbM family methyltransferase
MKNGKTVLAEIGVGPLSMAFGKLVWDRPDLEVLMFEPHPKYYADIVKECNGRPNVKIFNYAIGDFDGESFFYDDETSSSLDGIQSPIIQNDTPERNKNKIKVNVRKISNFDDGSIDYLRLDTEGAEWFTLKHLVSRPRQITVEIYNDLATYINPYLLEIEQWAALNGYTRVAVQDSDFIYERQ